MKASLAIAFSLPLLFLTTPLHAQTPQTLPELRQLQSQIQTVAKNVLPATVALVSEEQGTSGSGIVTSPNGLIYTAAHVIQGAQEVTVIFPNGKQFHAQVLGANYNNDIALVQITEKQTFPYAPITKSSTLHAGDWLIALGHSKGFDPKRTPPIRFGRVTSTGPGNFFTSDCTLIGGDSGGPIFNIHGQLVGINSNIGQSLNNNNHAGTDGFTKDLPALLQGKQWGQLSFNPFSNPDMPAMGLEIAPDTQNQNLPGIGVNAVLRNSPADQAGILPGDRILQLDQTPIENGKDLLLILAKKNLNAQLKVTLSRNNQLIHTTLKLRSTQDLFPNEQ